MHKVSPSQITEAERCLRRWWWQSVKGFRKPDTPQTLLGQSIHAALEQKLLTGVYPNDSKLVERAAPAFEALDRWHEEQTGEPLPRPDRDAAPPYDVELDWALDTTGYPLPSRGRIDLVLSDRNTVVDWKTTSSLQWAKTSDQLLSDPQVVMYLDAMVQRGAVSLPSTFLHVYTTTKGTPTAQIVRTVVDAQSFSIGKAHIYKVMQRMADVIARDPDMEGVEANILACTDFGGCPHRDRCFSTKKEEQMDIKEKLAARKAAQVAPTMATGINPPEASASVEQKTPTHTAASVPAPVALEVSDVAYAGAVLCIGTIPLRAGSEWQHADEWLLGFQRQACESLKITHWGLADYGKGKAAIVALVDAACRAGKIPRYLLLDRRSALGDAVAEVLIPHYRDVFVKLG